jgi:hypothetical protein
LGFIFSVSVVLSGQGLKTQKLCFSANIICGIFYMSSQLTMSVVSVISTSSARPLTHFRYTFLLERARIVRAPFVRRRKDWIWISGITMILAGLLALAINGYISPIAELSALDGRCRIGLPPQVSLALLLFDAGVHIALTAIFFYLLRPMVSFDGVITPTRKFDFRLFRLFCSRECLADNDTDSRTSAINRNVQFLLWKSLCGSTVIMLSTVGNMTQLYVMNGKELGWICLTICTLDSMWLPTALILALTSITVSWGVIVTNWLTMGSAEAEDDLNKSVKATRESAVRSRTLFSPVGEERVTEQYIEKEKTCTALPTPERTYSGVVMEHTSSVPVPTASSSSNWQSALQLLEGRTD